VGCPTRIIPTAGRAGDAPQALSLIARQQAKVGIAGTAHDTDAFHAAIAARSARAVIPSHPSRAQRLPLDRHFYQERHLVGCCIGRLGQLRRVATR